MAKLKQISIDVDVNRIIESHRESFSERENDILRRLLLGRIEHPASTVTKLDVAQFGERTTGLWQVKFGETIVGATSLKDAYCKLLVLAIEQNESFLERFSKHKGKSRYYVARKPEQLYTNSPHLAAKHALQLLPGWFVDTNLSETQVGTRARVAAREAGLFYGREAWIKNQSRLV